LNNINDLKNINFVYGIENGNGNGNYKKYNYKDVEQNIEDLYFDLNHRYSSA